MTAKRPTSFASPNFSVKVNRWPFFDGRRVTRQLGRQAVKLIQARLRKGRQADGSPLPPYSDVYRAELAAAGAGTRRDLELSGRLVEALKVLRSRRNSVTVGWGRTSKSPNTIRYKGGLIQGKGGGQRHRAIVKRLTRGDANTQPREVLGLTKSDRKALVKWLKARRQYILRVR